MTSKQLFDALRDIDTEYILSAAPGEQKPSKRRKLRVCIIAATLCMVLVCTAAIAPLFVNDSEDTTYGGTLNGAVDGGMASGGATGGIGDWFNGIFNGSQGAITDNGSETEDLQSQAEVNRSEAEFKEEESVKPPESSSQTDKEDNMKKKLIIAISIVAALAIAAVLVVVGKRHYDRATSVSYKPVIYLYPETETEASVKLDYSGELTCTYPEYKNGWKVTAQPGGTLTDKEGKVYNYLYWEGITDTQWDLSKGFCIKGEETAEFLETALAELGLTRREANEFIVYWLPKMQENEYNLITFQTELYEETAKLKITPKPDTVIRVFMAWKPLEEYVEIPEQELTAPEREGFVAVEWGGSEVE